MNSLIKITKLLSNGEKIIVLDAQANPKFVIMDIDEYEKITNNRQDDLTEEKILSKINRDIATWKDLQSVKSIDDTIDAESNDLIQNIWQNKWEDDDEDNNYYFEPIDNDAN